MALSFDGVQVIDRLQVLVLATQDIAGPICDALGSLPSVDCVTARDIADPEEDQLSWLCSVLFPNLQTIEGSQAHWDLSLYAWSRFDVVILQDLWRAGVESATAKLQFAGRVFASWDNDRGNFSTRKIVLVTDPALFTFRAREYSSNKIASVSHAEAQHIFDPKSAIEFISLCDADNSIEHLLRSMMGHVQTPKATKSHPVHTAGQEQLTAEMAKDLHDTIRRSVISPVIEAAAPAIQKTIPRSTSLLLVDDEKNALENAHKALTGSALPHANHGDSPLTVSLVTWPRGKREVATNFKDLVNRCTSLIKAELKPPNQAQDGVVKTQDVVVITDVLFELANSTQTGIDLIKELRDAFENQLGIVVFTGFKTPFVAMSAYLNGADYVVEKGGYGGSHETLQMSGNDRLLEALSFLCFQRAYLRNMRSSCESLITGNANEKMPDNNAIGQRIRQFVRTMPQGTVSLHLQKEWADTFYLLKRIQIQSAPSDSELRAIFKDMQEKYDHA